MYRLAARVFVLVCASVAAAIAHEGHGAPVVHWHDWDYTLLTLLACAIAGVAWRFMRRKI